LKEIGNKFYRVNGNCKNYPYFIIYHCTET